MIVTSVEVLSQSVEFQNGAKQTTSTIDGSSIRRIAAFTMRFDVLSILESSVVEVSSIIFKILL
jgi:hypothetical protein